MSTTTDSLCTVCAARLSTGDEQVQISDAVADWLLAYRKKDHRQHNLITDLRTSKADALDLLALIAQTARSHKPDNPAF